jgi:hypothetical protein
VVTGCCAGVEPEPIRSGAPRVGVDAGHPAPDEVHAGARQAVGNLQVGQHLTGRRLVQPQPLDL